MLRQLGLRARSLSPSTLTPLKEETSSLTLVWAALYSPTLNKDFPFLNMTVSETIHFLILVEKMHKQ